jgi:6-phosphogluconolactonase
MAADAGAAGLTLVYVASAAGKLLTAFVLDPRSGGLECVQQLPIRDGVTPLALDPGRRFLFAGFRAERSAVETFALDRRTARLEPLGTTPLADPPMAIATDTTGTFLLTASYAAASFGIYRIDGDGQVDPDPVTRQATPPRAHAILTDPTNRYLFVTALGGDAILQYLFDALTGRVEPNSISMLRVPQGTGPRHLAFHPDADVLYVNGELDGNVRSYDLDAFTGRLSAGACASMLAHGATTVPWAAELAVHPGGEFLYASERRASTLTIFDLRGERGTLTRTQILATERQPRAFAIEPDGRYLVVAGEVSNMLAVYAIDPASGALELRDRYSVAEKPVWIAAVKFAPT